MSGAEICMAPMTMARALSGSSLLLAHLPPTRLVAVMRQRSILFVVFAAEDVACSVRSISPLIPCALLRHSRHDQFRYDRPQRNASDQTTGLIEIPADTSNRLN